MARDLGCEEGLKNTEGYDESRCLGTYRKKGGNGRRCALIDIWDPEVHGDGTHLEGEGEKEGDDKKSAKEKKKEEKAAAKEEKKKAKEEAKAAKKVKTPPPQKRKRHIPINVYASSL